MECYEARGYARDMCGYMRNFLGTMFLDKYYFTGGPFPKFDFAWSVRHCPAGHPKWHQIVSEYQGIPMYYVDDETMLAIDGDQEARIEYVAGQYLDSIEWMEKITKRKYDDEKGIEAMRNYFINEGLWGEINLLNGAIPAPLDIKSMFALMPISMLRRHEKVATEFLTELRDEVKERIANKIAAVPAEAYRMCMLTPPPWSFLKVFRYLENPNLDAAKADGETTSTDATHLVRTDKMELLRAQDVGLEIPAPEEGKPSPPFFVVMTDGGPERQHQRR